MIAMPASDFARASDLPASQSREAQLEDLVRTQALALERLEAMLDGQLPQQQPTGGKLSSQEKAQIIETFSNLEARIKAQETATKGLADFKKEIDGWAAKISDIQELAIEGYRYMGQRLSAIEDRAERSEANKAHVEAIYQELLRRQKTGQKGISYADAANLLGRDKSRVCQLKRLIDNDSRMDIIWHPRRKNAKLICLKNYK